MTTRLYYHRASLEHDPGSWHPERPSRIGETVRHLSETGLLERLQICEPEEVDVDRLLTIHTQRLLDDVKSATDRGITANIDVDTVIMPATWPAVLRASGGTLEACDAVMAGGGNAFCLHRPPGHHAEHDRAMGFCYVNHVAVAARYLLDAHGLERVAIIDWDVHHGNGTQHTFEEDPRVFFFSVHQSPHFPGTGDADETGRGAGVGTTLNIPLSPGHDDDDYLALFRDRLEPALADYAPQFVLISAGFDAHQEDPLGDMKLTAGGFGELTKAVTSMADRWAEGRCVSVLEGGYDLTATAASVAAHLEALLAAGS